MRIFYFFYESVVTFSFVSWYRSLTLKKETRRDFKVQGVITACGQIAGMTLTDLPHLYKIKTLKKTQPVLADPS